jgi:hypothetical protein
MLSLSIITISFDDNSFYDGQAYTAISRARGLNWSAFKVDQESVREFQRLEEVARSLPELMN